MVFGGLTVRIAVVAMLILVFIGSLIDSTTLKEAIPIEWVDRIFVIVALILVISVGVYLIRQHLDKFLFIFFGVFFAGSFFTSGNILHNENRFDVSGKSNDISLPPYIHIILDEHIGIEGIPPEENKKIEVTNSLKSKYIQNGFQVYGRAYSRYTATKDSFTSFLMLKAIDNPSKYYQRNAETYYLKENKYFEKLSRNGYHINVIQSTFLDLCNKNKNISIKRCITYDILPSYSLENRPDSLLLVFSSVLKKIHIRHLYGKLQQSSLGKSLGLPYLVTESAQAAYNAFPMTLELLKNVEMGNAYFVHLLLPHGPYRFNKECSFTAGRTPSESETKYQHYLEQVACVQSLLDQLLSKLDDNSKFKNSTIIIHGDHGSRVVPPEGIDSDENFIQSFSTFFAVRSPEHMAGYDRRPLALDDLLGKVVSGKEHNMDNNGSVYLDKSYDEVTTRLIRTPLPPFAHGLPVEKW